MKKYKKERMVNILVLVITIILFLVIAELAFRMVSYRLRGVWCDEDSLDCFIEKGKSIYSPRLSAYSMEEEEGVFRIAILGDSFTYGFGEEEGKPIKDKAFPEQLEVLLNNKFDDYKYEVLNFGYPSVTALEEYFVLKELVLDYNPDLFVLQITSNDAFSNVYDLNPFTYCDIEFSPAEKRAYWFHKNLKLPGYLYVKLTDSKTGHYVEKINPGNPIGGRCFRRSLERIKDVLDEKGIPAFIVYIQDEVSEKNGEYQIDLELISEYNQTFAETGFDYLHTYPYMLESRREVLSDDGYHYNTKGNLLIAKVILNHLTEHELVPSCEAQACSLKIINLGVD